MNDWQTDLRNRLAGLTSEMEMIAQEVSREATAVIDRFVALSDDFMTDMTTIFTQETETPTPISEFLDRDLEEFLTSLFRPFVDLSMQDFNGTTAPIVKPHALCVNCEYYHGHSYGGTHLVCGMHPYGIVEGQTECADRSTKFVDILPIHRTDTDESPQPRSNFPPDWWNS